MSNKSLLQLYLLVSLCIAPGPASGIGLGRKASVNGFTQFHARLVPRDTVSGPLRRSAITELDEARKKQNATEKTSFREEPVRAVGAFAAAESVSDATRASNNTAFAAAPAAAMASAGIAPKGRAKHLNGSVALRQGNWKKATQKDNQKEDMQKEKAETPDREPQERVPLGIVGLGVIFLLLCWCLGAASIANNIIAQPASLSGRVGESATRCVRGATDCGAYTLGAATSCGRNVTAIPALGGELITGNGGKRSDVRRWCQI